MGFKRKVKDQDMFGVPVVLNFNKQGDTFKTFLGGLFSICIKIALGVFLMYKFLRMTSKGDNTYESR
jgi:hypothetical protein